MSVQEFLRLCFYPRLLKGKNLKKSRVGYVVSLVPLPLRKDFLDTRYRDTGIWDKMARHPILCLDGHSTWEPGEEKAPSSFTFALEPAITLSTLKKKIERGDYISGAHFKHWINTVQKCNCSNGLIAGASFLDDQREAALRNRTNGTPVLQDHDGRYELKFHIQKETEDLFAGVHPINNISEPGMKRPSDLGGSTSIWLQSRNAGALPGNCAGFICN
jgi:hypothetical protein